MKGHVSSSAVAISLTKGFHSVKNKDGTHSFKLISDLVKSHLGVPCSVMMGANLANEIGKGVYKML